MVLSEKKKVALVLSGGGIKAAAFHIGVCLALREKGFKFVGGSVKDLEKSNPNEPMAIRTYVGSSAGAFISAILAAGYPLESLVNAFEVGTGMKHVTFETDPAYKLKPLGYRDIFSINGDGLLNFFPNILRHKSLVTGGIEALIKNGFKINGLFTTHGLEKYLRKHVLKDNEFGNLGVELFVIATQLNHTRKAIFGNFHESSKTKRLKFVNYATISQAVAASAALPPVFSPYSIRKPPGKEMYFFDGEIRDTLSTHVAVDHGADLVISSYSIQPYHYTNEMGSLHRYGIPVIVNQALYQVIQQKIEKHIEHQAQIHNIYNAVDGYMKQVGAPNEQREKLLEIIRTRVNFKPHVDYIYIHPMPQNYEMFFVDHFSLNPHIMARIVRIGFKSAINMLRAHDL